MPAPPRRARGFTVIELIVVIVLFSVLGASLAVFYRPAFDASRAIAARSALVAEANHAVWRMVREVQRAVPNSLRAPNEQCVETVPTSTGGRMRLGDDTASGADLAAEPGTTATGFDVLTPMSTLPAVGDWVVVENQNPNDVYSGVNRAQITSLATPSAAVGAHRLGIAGGLAIPPGYESGRFVVVPNAQQAVVYVCEGASGALDANGNGTGRIVRLQRAFDATVPTACPSTAGADVLVTGVTRCRFLYQANAGATQQSGYLGIDFEIARRGERAALSVGAHVLNAP